MDPIADILRPSLADRYRLEREIGRGGMATVFLAHDLRHDRPVALKVLHPELGAVLGVERFLAEIRVTANLQHPNLLPLFDSGEANGLLYYVMPFVEGESLRARLERERQLPVDETVRYAASILDGLALAHAQGVVHRDLKPENILLLHGQPVIADFGIALAVSKAGGQRVTQTGISLGTPQYMSPEQAAADRAIDGRSDIYAVGAMIYEMLAGQPPHTGGTMQAILAQVLTEVPRDVRSLRPSVSVSLANVVARALAKVPADRFATAAEFGRALRDLAVLTTGAAPAPTSARTRWQNVVWPAVAMLATAATIAAWVMPRTNTASGREAPQIRRQLTFEGNVQGAAISQDGKWVAYVTRDCTSFEACGTKLKVREVDGTQSITLLDWGGGIGQPRWTADGATILLSGTETVDDSLRLYQINRLGGAPKRLFSNPTAFTPTHDGSAVLVAHGVPGRQQLTRIELASLNVSAPVALPTGWAVEDLADSPRGDLVAASFSGPAGSGLALLDRTGKARDTRIGLFRQTVRWTPDGTGLLTMMIDAGPADNLIRFDVRNGHLDARAKLVVGQISTAYQGVFDIGPTRSLVVRGWTEQEMPVRRLDVADTAWRSLVHVTGFLSPSDFSADGSRVLASNTDNLGDNLYSYDVMTGESRLEYSALATGRWWARWSPDGRRLAYLRVAESVGEITMTTVSGGAERALRPSTSSPYWLSDSTILLTEVNAFVVIDTTGRVRSRVIVPDSVGGTLANGTSFVALSVDAAHARVVYWSDRAGALVEGSLTDSAFNILQRSDHRLLPAGWSANDGYFYVDADPRISRASRIMKQQSAVSPASFVSNVPVRCGPFALVRANGTRAACRVDRNVLDVWLVEPSS